MYLRGAKAVHLEGYRQNINTFTPIVAREQFGEASRSDSGVVGFKGAMHLSEGMPERKTTTESI